MITPSQFIRLIGIQRILIRHGFDEIVFATHLLRPIHYLLYLLPWNWVRKNRAPRAERLLHVLEDLGPIYVKLGQLLSTRRDLLPDDMISELGKLQDRVPSFPSTRARKIIETAFGKSIGELFKEFDETPLASASIAQVHAARLHDGRKVVVKVVRPDIEKTIRSDLGLIQLLAEMAERYWADGRRMRPTGVVAEYEKIILDELDLVREAANASQLRRNFEGQDNLYIPKVEWDLTRRNVMVMEHIEGIPIDDIPALKAAGVDLKTLSETGVEVFFTQVFRDRFFHADMHPGNLFVIPPKDGQSLKLAAVDFGIMGSLSEFDQHYLSNNFLAFLNRDYRRVAELHVESAWVPPDTRVDDLEFAIRSVCEPMLERPIKEVSFGGLLLRLFQTARRFHMEILPQLLLLQKTIVNIEGLGQRLYPDLDLWGTAMPWLERWMSERVGVRRLVKTTQENLPNWAGRLPALPGTVMDVLELARGGNLQVKPCPQEMEALRRELRELSRNSSRLRWSVLGSAFMICAVVLLGFGGFSPAMSAAHTQLVVWVFAGIGGLLILLSIRGK